MALACVWHVLVYLDVHMTSTSTLEMLLSILEEVRVALSKLLELCSCSRFCVLTHNTPAHQIANPKRAGTTAPGSSKRSPIYLGQRGAQLGALGRWRISGFRV